jgi:hypothetical protein
MNFRFYAEKLRESGNFKKFIKENKNAFPCSCFFVIDKEAGSGDKQHFDFYLSPAQKIFSFQLENNKNEEIDMSGKEAPGKISIGHDFDFNDLENMIKKRMEHEKIDKKVQKMLFSLQNIKGRDFIVGTIFISSFGLLSTIIDIESMEIKEFKKTSFLDLMNIFKKKE